MVHGHRLGLGGVALLVGGVGIANVMVISVLERRAEIGLRRALGATRRHVATQFLGEALLLSLIGGVGGVALGVLATSVYSSIKGWDTIVPQLAIFGGCLMVREAYVRHTCNVVGMADEIPDKPKRKAMFLSPAALRNLAATASRRRTEREAVEEALQLLAERDAQRAALDDFIDWATNEWGSPTPEEQAKADEIWAGQQ